MKSSAQSTLLEQPIEDRSENAFQGDIGRLLRKNSPSMLDKPASPRVLAIDDQEINLDILANILSPDGIEIIRARDGGQALAQLAAGKVDLILLDVFMPEVDGFEVCRRIQANPAWTDIPIIFLSAADDRDVAIRALGSGGVDYVGKPFNHAELLCRVRTHLALKSSRDRLRQLAEDKDELLGILAHDMKNRLGGMLMSAQLLQGRAKSLGDQRFARMAGNVVQGTEHMLGFIKEFLANSSAEYELTLNFEKVNLSDAATRVVQRHAEAAQRKDIELVAELSEPCPVKADRAALEQVLENLLSNAIKFSPTGKTVHVTLRRLPDGRAECCVQDQGPGFTEEDRAHMFKRYRRLSARPTSGEPSTGLGLSIAKKLIDQMGGELHCETKPGHGSAFIVRLPGAGR